jgi:hypothetical protein
MVVNLDKFDHIIYHKSMCIQCPSHTTHVKFILQATSFGSGFEPSSDLYKNKSTENYATVVLNYMIYLLTAIGLLPGGSSTVHIYTQTIHRTTQSTQTIHRTTQSTQTIHRTTQSTQTIHRTTQFTN